MSSSTRTDSQVGTGECQLTCDFEILRRSPILTGVNLDVVRLFAYLAKRRSYTAGEYLIEQGKRADRALLLIRGSVEITVVHRHREIVLQELEVNTFFGELSLLANFKWFFNARAAADSEVLVISQTAFQKVLEKYPEHKDKLIERVVKLRVDRLIEQTGYMLDRLSASAAENPKVVI